MVKKRVNLITLQEQAPSKVVFFGRTQITVPVVQFNDFYRSSRPQKILEIWANTLVNVNDGSAGHAPGPNGLVCPAQNRIGCRKTSWPIFLAFEIRICRLRPRWFFGTLIAEKTPRRLPVIARCRTTRLTRQCPDLGRAGRNNSCIPDKEHPRKARAGSIAAGKSSPWDLVLLVGRQTGRQSRNFSMGIFFAHARIANLDQVRHNIGCPPRIQHGSSTVSEHTSHLEISLHAHVPPFQSLIRFWGARQHAVHASPLVLPIGKESAINADLGKTYPRRPAGLFFVTPCPSIRANSRPLWPAIPSRCEPAKESA